MTSWIRSRIWVFLLCMLILTGAMGFTTIRIEETYLQNHSYFFDPVSYSFYNARLYVRLADEGRLSLAAQEWLGNGRHPLRTVPLLLFAPELLASRMGHMTTALPMFGIFLFLLGWTVYRRTECVPYAVGCMVLFSAIPGMFSRIIGLGAYWLDLPAACLVGGAALCLLNSSGARDLRWLAGFAVLASLAALSRYVAAMYAFVVCAPILVYYLIQRWWQEGNVVKTVLLPLGVIGAVIGVLSGYFLIAHFRANVGFYSVYGYALGHDMLSSAGSVVGSVVSFTSRPGILVLGAVGLVNMTLFWRDASRDWESLAVSIWLASAVIVFLVLVVRVVGAGQASLYAVPVIFAAFASPAPLGRQLSSHRLHVRLTGVVVVASLLLGGRAILRNYQLATHPSPEAQEQKALDVALAQALSAEGDQLVWNAYFDEYSWIPTMEALYRFGRFPLPAGQDYFFSVHQSVFKGNYPGLTPDQVSRLIYDNVNQWVDIAVVFDDPTAADTRFNNEYSRTVARYVSEVIHNDARWKRVFVIESSKYGTLAGYRNLTPRSGNYDQLLRSKVVPKP